MSVFQIALITESHLGRVDIRGLEEAGAECPGEEEDGGGDGLAGGAVEQQADGHREEEELQRHRLLPPDLLDEEERDEDPGELGQRRPQQVVVVRGPQRVALGRARLQGEKYLTLASKNTVDNIY